MYTEDKDTDLLANQRQQEANKRGMDAFWSACKNPPGLLMKAKDMLEV